MRSYKRELALTSTYINAKVKEYVLWKTGNQLRTSYINALVNIFRLTINSTCNITLSLALYLKEIICLF